MTIPILSWNVASSSTMPIFLTIILSCLQVPLLCRLLTMTIPILSWNVASSSVLCQFFLTIFVMSTSSFTMQSFNHDNSYIVMERGKFLSTMPFFLTIILPCLQVPLLCRLLTMTIPILSWNVASSYYANFFYYFCHVQVPLLCRVLTMTIPKLSWNVASSSTNFF